MLLVSILKDESVPLVTHFFHALFLSSFSVYDRCSFCLKIDGLSVGLRLLDLSLVRFASSLVIEAQSFCFDDLIVLIVAEMPF